VRARRVALILWSVVAVSGCGGYQALEVGQCLPEGAGVEGVREARPEIVRCSLEHRYEVFARRDLDPPSDDWPGTDLVDLNAERLCGLAVQGATGRPIDDLPDGVEVVRVAPTESSWADGDREVECLFRFPEPTTDTLVRN
jgi:hypothetical protein